jgi:hypothetical protein
MPGWVHDALHWMWVGIWVGFGLIIGQNLCSWIGAWIAGLTAKKPAT